MAGKRVARVNLRYDAKTAQIVSIDLIAAPKPVSAFTPKPTSTGAWLTVADAKRKKIFHKPLPDPFVGGEALGKNNKLRRSKKTREQFASVEVPWPGKGAKIEIHARDAAPRRIKGKRAKAKPSLLLRAPLAPVASHPARARKGVAAKLFGAPTPAFPVTVIPRWGHANPKALTLAFMPEGFLAGEMQKFRDQVDLVMDFFETMEPYRSMLNTLKVARIEIPSDTNVIGNAPGRTFFKAHFAGIVRVIEIDQQIALNLISQYWPNNSARALVMVNTKDYGGSGGMAVVFSCEPNWSPHIAIHELGHSHFGLADEYSDAGQSATKDPTEPNVSADFDRKKLKWAALVDAGTPLPTLRAGDPAPSPPDKRIGAFEGGKYQEKGVWRPSFECKMRHIDTPYFCGVCQQTIRQELQRFL
jgi:IgA peptidase M64